MMEMLRAKHVEILVRLFAILLSAQVYETGVMAQLPAHSKNLTDVYGRLEKNESHLPTCNMTVNPNDAELFLHNFTQKKANFAYFYLNLPDTVVVKHNDDIFMPFTWVWTSNAPGGAYPYLSFAYDAVILSSGLLKYYTLLNVSLRLEPHPEACSLDFGTNDTLRAIEKALANMVLQYLPPSIERNYSVFCHSLKLDPFAEGDPVFRLKTYIGHWKDPTAYSCWELGKCQSIDVNCRNTTIKVHNWIAFFYFFSLFCFMYLPIPMSWLFDKMSLPTRNVNPTTNRMSQDQGELTVFLNDSPTTQNCGTLKNSPTIDEEDWMYLGKDKPVAVVHLFSKPFRYLQKRYPRLMPRLARLFISCLILLPVFVKVIYYHTVTSFSTIQRMKAGIPVGFLSIPYGFHQSAGNWLTGLGGPYFVGVFYVMFVICVCVPKDISAFISSALPRKGCSKHTLLSSDVLTLEQFGAVELRKEESQIPLFGVLIGNLYTILNVQKTWIYATTFWEARFRRWIVNEDRNSFVLSILKVLYFMLCLAEVVLCLMYYGLPSVYGCVNSFRATLHQWSTFSKMRKAAAILVVLLLPYSTYAYFLVYMRGSQFIFLAIQYTYTGFAIYPEISLGFVIVITTSIVYLAKSLQKLTDCYLSVFDEIVKISKTLESEKGESSATVTETAIVANQVDENGIDMVVINGIKISFTEQQLQLLNSAKSRETTTTYIRWRGPYPGIPCKLFGYVIERCTPLRGAVFVFFVETFGFGLAVGSMVTLIQIFNRMSTFTPVANVTTAIVLAVLPNLAEFLRSTTEKEIQKQIRKDKLTLAVKKYYSQTENAD